jgi:riboflavin kinase/FMN adenylyltransferase
MNSGKSKIIWDLEEAAGVINASVAAIGTFDGVHIGHQSLIKYTVERAEEQGISSVVVTFEPHPAEVLRGIATQRLTLPEEKLFYLSSLGPDIILVLDFNGSLSQLTSHNFVSRILCGALKVREVSVGFNFHFGRNGSGNGKFLAEEGREHGFDVNILSPVCYKESPVSSSRIRNSLIEGQMVDSDFMLGRNYTITGEVVHGEGRGRKLGFPTANILPTDSRKLLPARGVYIGLLYGLPNRFDAAKCLVSIGVSPTFGARDLPRVEVFIPSYSGSLYGLTLKLELCQWLRKEEKFSSSEELVARIRRDFDTLEGSNFVD